MISLAHYLEEKSETQAAFAARAGLSDSTLSRLLGGKSPPSPEVVERIHQATGGHVTANDLFAAWRFLQQPATKASASPEPAPTTINGATAPLAREEGSVDRPAATFPKTAA